MPSKAEINRIDTRQSVELAEGVEVHARVAGVYPRAMALLLDMFFLLVINIIGIVLITLLYFGFMGVEAADVFFSGLYLLLAFVSLWFYFFLFERGVKAATPGKRIYKLKVVSMSGTRATTLQIVIRNLLRAADFLPGVVPLQMGVMIGSYGLGMLSSLFTKRFQRVGDLVANTIVVYADTPVQHVSPVEFTDPAKMPRFSLEREEEAALRGFSQRAGIWSVARRIEMANHAEELTGMLGAQGLEELLANSKWIEERR